MISVPTVCVIFVIAGFFYCKCRDNPQTPVMEEARLLEMPVQNVSTVDQATKQGASMDGLPPPAYHGLSPINLDLMELTEMMAQGRV